MSILPHKIRARAFSTDSWHASTVTGPAAGDWQGQGGTLVSTFKSLPPFGGRYEIDVVIRVRQFLAHINRHAPKVVRPVSINFEAGPLLLGKIDS
jgi:hypothetical protein